MIGRCAVAVRSLVLLAVAVTSDPLVSFMATVALLALVARREEARRARR